MSSPSIWYMRDNHTFRPLPLNVDGALIALREERDCGETYGMLCSKHPELRDYVPATTAAAWDEFEAKARPWLARAVALVYADPINAGRTKEIP